MYLVAEGLPILSLTVVDSADVVERTAFYGAITNFLTDGQGLLIVAEGCPILSLTRVDLLQIKLPQLS